ncbi:MAG: LuxR family transcriptional regulator [Pseudomonadota bacterium]
MPQSLQSYIEASQAAETETTLFHAFDLFAGSYGVDVTSYHIVSHQLQSVPVDVGLVRETFPPDWVRKYLANDYSKIDPVLQQSRREARPFHWFDVGERLQLSPVQQDFLEELRGAGLSDGLAVPVFGPNGTMAYFGLGTCGGDLRLPQEQELELQFACQQTHNRYLDISGHNDPKPAVNLSGREKEIMGLIATGLSNNLIAERLGISENTVDTIIRRAFKKLGVNNRISAVLRAVGSGLVLP